MAPASLFTVSALAAIGRLRSSLPDSIRAWMVASCLFGLSAAAQAPLDIRLALVIGNSAYAGSPLPNPANDARAMAQTLRGLGFGVVELQDASKAQMAQAIAKMGETLKGKQAVGMLYYAGHGLQLDWRNFMVPVEAKLSSANDVPAQAVDVNTVIEAFRGAGTRMNILVLDACRDNPFGSIASGKGLAQMDAPTGTFLAYATAPGNVAEDGDVKSGNGLYTQFLLQELKKPTARIEDVFKRVRLQVRQKSEGRQIPWESTSLEDDFVFNSGIKVAIAKPDDRAKEQAFNQQKADWDKISESKNPDDYYAFLNKYPNGSISEVAQAQLERLQKSRIAAAHGKDGIVQIAGAARFRLGDTMATVVRDALTGLEKERTRTRVTKVDESVVEINGGRGVLTPEGATIRNRNIANLSPPRLDLPAGEYAVGKKWTYRSIETSPNGASFWVEGEVKIVALETITVPAGTFKTFKLELESISQHGTRVRLTRWYEPDWGFSIKMLREIRPRSGTVEREIHEMVERQRGAG